MQACSNCPASAIFQWQDDELSGYITDPSVFNIQTFQDPYDPDDPELYDAKDKERDSPPEDSLAVPTLSRPQILTKCTPDDDNLCARMSGGEIHINSGTLKDKSTIDKSKLAGTSDTVGTNIICGVDLELPHPPDGTLQDRSTNGINTSMLTKGTKPPPPPEPPPTIYNIHQKLNKNGMVYKDPTIFNFKVKDIKWKFQSIVPYNYDAYQCNVLIEWENGETTNKLPKVISTDDPVTCVIYTHEKDIIEKHDWKHPRTCEQTLGLDKRNRDTLRGDATTLEPTQFNEYDTFIGKGHYTKVKTPDGFK
jgi:hypothetical protein